MRCGIVDHMPTAALLPLLTDQLPCCAQSAGDGLGAESAQRLAAVLKAGLLERDQRGRWAYYRLVPGGLDALAGLVATIAGPS
jgi:hypothetical protein